MTSDIEAIDYRNISWDLGLKNLVRASDEFDEYIHRRRPKHVEIKRKIGPTKVYKVDIREGKDCLQGKCECRDFEIKFPDVCKHVYIIALRTIGDLLRTKDWDKFSKVIRYVLVKNHEVLWELPGIDLSLLEGFIAKNPIPENPVVLGAEESTDEWQTGSDEHPEEKFQSEVAQTMQEKEPEPEPEPKPTVSPPTVAIAPIPATVPSKLPKAFGGTVKDIPKNLVTTLHGKPYVTKAGLVYVARQMGLHSISTEPIQWSWKGKDKKAVFKATAIFSDGTTYTAHGIAFADPINIKMESIWGHLDQMAETRAVARALRNAIAFGTPSAEETADFGGSNE